MKKTARLNKRCRILMAGGAWWSIEDMAVALGCTECGASARIRDQRKAKYGRHQIVKRPKGGGFEYRMIPSKQATCA